MKKTVMQALTCGAAAMALSALLLGASVSAAVPENGFYETVVGYRYYQNGSYVTGWQEIDGESYYFLKSNGYMVTENRFIGGEFCAFDESGVYIGNTGFCTDEDGTRYYEDGKAVRGWKEIDGDTYYFYKATGLMVTESRTVGGVWYTFAEDGKLITAEGFVEESGVTRYYVDGKYVTGWQEIDGNTYYFYKATGYMVTEDRFVGGIWCCFDESGVYSAYTGFAEDDGGVKYYIDGAYATGWQEIDGESYYFYKGTGYMAVGNVTVGGVEYTFDEDGKLDDGTASESEAIKAAVEAALESGGGKLSFVAGFYSETTEEWLGGEMLAAFGLAEGHTIDITDDSFAALYAALQADQVNAQSDVTFTASDAEGGSYTATVPVALRQDITAVVRKEILAEVTSNGLWSGKSGDEVEFAMELGEPEFISVELLTERFNALFDLPAIFPHEMSVSFGIDENEYYDALVEYYNDAAVGETVEEWLDAQFRIYGVFEDVEVMVRIALIIHVEVTKLPPDNGFAEVDGQTGYYVYGVAQTGWRYIDGGYYYFDENGAMATGETTIDGVSYTFGTDGVCANPPEGLSTNFDAEYEDIVLIRDGAPRFSILMPDTHTVANVAAIERLAAAFEEITGAPLSEYTGHKLTVDNVEAFPTPLLRFEGYADNADYVEVINSVGLLDGIVFTDGDTVIMSGLSEGGTILAIDRMIELIARYADGDDLIIPALSETIEDEIAAERDPGAYEDFVFTFYHGPLPKELTEDTVKLIAEAGFTRLAIHTWDNPGKFSEACELAAEYGLDVCAYVHLEIGDIYALGEDELWTQEAVDERIQYVIDLYGHENVVEWQIRDEPPRDTKLALGMIADAFSRLDPDRPVLINQHPNFFRDEDYYAVAEEYIDAWKLESLSFDRYGFMETDLANVGVVAPRLTDALYVDEMLTYTALSLKYGLPSTMIVLASEHWGSQQHYYLHYLQEEQMRWEANLNLVYGFDCVSYFTLACLVDSTGLHGGLLDCDFQPTEQYYFVKNIAADVVPVGQQLVDKDVNAVFAIDMDYGSTTHNYVPYGPLGDIGGSNGLISFYDDGSFYLANFIYDSDVDANVFTLNEIEGGSLEWFDPADSTWKSAESNPEIAKTADGYTVSLPSGDGVLLRAAANA